jgi:peptidyl-tRNA hydrolase
MKMYILIKEDVSQGFAVVMAAHASLACYLKYKDKPEMIEWISGIFKKSVCMVNDGEFNQAKQFEDHVVLTESALQGREVAIAFCPRKEFPKAFKFYRLWK